MLSLAEETYQVSYSIKEVWNQASARNFQALVWLEYGEIDKSLAALEECIRLASQGNPVYELWYSAILCHAYAELGATDLRMEVCQAHRVANKDVPMTPSRNITLVSFALFELANHQPDTAAATLADCTPDAVPWEAMAQLARCRLALARADFSAFSAIVNSVIQIAREYNLGQYLPEALFLKGKCLFVQGDFQEARILLEEARAAAEKPGSRRPLWQIIAILAELEPDPELSNGLKAQAREIVQFIANHITRTDLREAFVRSTALGGVLP